MLLSIVIPVYNEAESLPKLFQALTQVLPQIDADYELLFVNDGSNDDSLRFLRGVASSDPRVKVLGFSRNFGHQAAIRQVWISQMAMRWW
jgi:dolichol-phosphate mannosyltransferase